jgi:hypothetical protein
MHGGRAPAAGPTHPGFKHGRYSRVLDGKDIAEKYEMLRDDPKLLELSEEIAVLVALQQETLTKLGTGGTGFHTWQHVRHLAKEATEGPTDAWPSWTRSWPLLTGRWATRMYGRNTRNARR